MSLARTIAPWARWRYTNLTGAANTTAGLLVTPVVGSKGSWGTLVSGANMAKDCEGIFLWIHSGGTASANRLSVIDLGVDPAGGTSYTAVMSDIICGKAGLVAGSGSGAFKLFLPFKIKAGASLGVRSQSSETTGFRVGCTVYGQAGSQLPFPAGSYAEVLGYAGSLLGTSFTPGNATDGGWASLGTTTRNTFAWQSIFGINNTTVTAEYTYIDLAYGDASNKYLINRRMHAGNTSEYIGDTMGSCINPYEVFCDVPAGSNIYVRGNCLNAPDTGYVAMAIGIGG